MIQARNLSKYYGQGAKQVHALHSVNLTVQTGEFVAIVGPSGSGKSTLMNLLGCLDIPSGGEYLLGDLPVTTLSPSQLAKTRGEQIGFVFQGFNLLPRLTAIENVALPLVYKGVPRQRRTALAQRALEQVGLSARLAHRPAELSGGQQQRVAIARALIADPPLILADEPTGNLDSSSAKEVMQLFSRLNQSGRTVVLITHDSGIARQAQRRVAIRDGRLFEIV